MGFSNQVRTGGRQAALAAALMLTTALAGTGAAMPAFAQESAQRAYDIPAQPLPSALTAFGRQSGLQVSVPAALARGRTSGAVSGRLSANEAVSRLLAGTGLTYRIQGDVLTLSPAPTAEGATQLGALRVQGDVAGAGQGGASGAPFADEESDQARADAVYSKARSSAYIARETLERFRGASVADMVKGVAGVTAGDPRSANALDLNIRGVQGQGRIPVVIDGGQSTIDTYRGYAGQSQRNYLDPDLISSVSITKGPSLEANASGGIGGVVVMDTLKAADILRAGKDFGVRVRAGISDASTKDLPAWSAFQNPSRNDITRPGSHFYNLAVAKSWDRFDLVAAYAKRENGNYFSGSEGYEGFPTGRGLLATLNPAKTEVFNTSNSSESFLLKGTWKISDDQVLEAGYRRFDGRQGEIMASQIIRVNRERVPQWALGHMDLDAYNLRYRYRPANDLIDLKANLWLTKAESLAYNGLTGVTPWFLDRPTQWYDGPTFNTEDGYRDAYWNELSIERFGGDVTNTSRVFTGLGRLDFTYGGSFTSEDIKPGPNSPILEEDLRNNRYLRNAERKEYSLVGSVTWAPNDQWELTAGGRFNRIDIRDRNRTATEGPYEVIGRYRDTTFYMPNPTRPGALTSVARVYWFPDAQGNFTEASLFASPYEKGTVGDIRGWTTYRAGAAEDLEGPTSWTWSKPIRRKADAFMPTVSASYKPTENSLIYVKYAEGVKLPSLFESTLGLFTAAKPTDDLKPERSKSWEVGASILQRDLWKAGDRGALKVAYFDTRIRDLITRDYRTLSAGLIRNVDSFNVEGVELQGSYDMGRVFADLSAHRYFKAETCAPDIAAERRAYGQQRGIDELINTPDCVAGGFEGSYTNTQNPPKYNVNLTVGTRLFQERLIVGGRMVANSGPISKLDKEWNVGLSAIQQLYRKATVYDLFATYKVTDQVTLDANLDNVGDEYYLDPLSLAVVPAPGRTLRLALTWRY